MGRSSYKQLLPFTFALPFGLRFSIPFGWLPLVQGDNLAEYFVLTEQKRS